MEAYLATLPQVEQEALESLRRLIKETIPQVEERISYGTTVMFGSGTPLFGDLDSKHISLEPVEVIETAEVIHLRFRVVK